MAIPDKRPLKVFLCHAHADRDAVRALYARLKREGVDVWLDKEKLLPGADWEYEIRKAVRESDVVVVCLSRQFNQAGFRQKEVRIALEEADKKPEGEIFIIPARLEECDNLESLSKWHWVDLFESNGFQLLMRALRIRAEKIGAALREHKGGGATAPRPKVKQEQVDTDEISRAKAEQDAIEKARLDAEELERQKAAKEQADRDAAEKDARDKAERDAIERARLDAEELERQKAAKEQADREAAEKGAREKAERDALEKARLDVKELRAGLESVYKKFPINAPANKGETQVNARISEADKRVYKGIELPYKSYISIIVVLVLCIFTGFIINLFVQNLIIPLQPTHDPNIARTAAVHTIVAELTLTATAFTPSLVPPTKIFIISPTPTFTSTSSKCDDYDFDPLTVDVNIPDGTVMTSGQEFLKTWRIRNTGYCSWGGGYKITHVYGERMSGQAKALTSIIEPGQEVDISVQFIAPITTGEHISAWQMVNSQGIEFTGKYLFVKIIVK